MFINLHADKHHFRYANLVLACSHSKKDEAFLQLVAERVYSHRFL